jgi:hypothetical protein
MAVAYGPTSIAKFGDPTTSGLLGKRYVGCYTNGVPTPALNDPSWFRTATLQGSTSTVTALNAFTSSADTYSWMFLGYFKPTTTEIYTFYCTVDDNGQIWIGDKAISGYDTSNSLLTTTSAGTEFSAAISLIAGKYYPIRIMFGENLGNDYITVSFATATIAKTTNGSGYYFGGDSAWNRFGAL